METIYALASAQGRGGVSVIRVSGRGALRSLQRFCKFQSDIKPRHAYFKTLRDSVSRETSGEVIDDALVLYFKAPHSFTGEDVVEYHLHGGKAIIQKMLAALSTVDNHRLAEPGEFTRRAFENGKMDLTQAEAIADLVDAETEFQRRQALSQAQGALYKLYEGWRTRIVKALAYGEAHLDFPDEDDVPDTLSDQVRQELLFLKTEIKEHLDDARRGERLRDGIRVAIIGAPNAGKSSLLNMLAQRDAAIVSDVAGTTRDVLEVPLDLGGYPVIMIDTAGLRPDELDGSDQSRIEEEGIRRAYKAARSADLKVLLFNGESLPKLDQNTLALQDSKSLMVINKTDLSDKDLPEGFFGISIKTEKGVTGLLAAIGEKVREIYGYTDRPSLSRERYREALQECVASIDRALEERILELSAENLRYGATAIGRITGKIDVEQLLDVIFRDFCIGK